ncbi:MAG: hypothetical protein UX08_C0017G0025 [Candidatus Collierbacteria bacterium GW2011_GWB1_45_35]|uniref:Uncharacterized protein n=2 Tax=Candidatus Collieribacteriota TaxID=1752725 RepID=A0A0G1NQ08_9BACT|nr:MAG: hypothetical protein UW48_C0009G0019 [Microgenomates group bacterium GW2011_GWC1_44_23]KKT86279.1 MAG: hypothetical protein UW84_C0013G0003 [Candidatus Collierbacteria bacterium GW2011_GWA2_44_99]KKT95248.1 MAG: hypothetical protein UW96_C0009G0019 [Candidatus Collierbacteria bacterium GW2011_GWA1_45_15]KKT99238.1 MAG: hypothetical protein UX01_C0011G0003 [Candidatus Collierbacteria bacterium GW2011_GWB2_45_17]KKU04767.1 MAG: hypothetical protein UX08_C0017G0025 [Candidatus Collierbacte
MYIISLWEEEAGEELDGWGNDGDNGSLTAKEGEDHKNQNQSTKTVHDGLKFVGQVSWKKGEDNLLAIERANGDEVKDGQTNIGEYQWS